MLLLDAVSAGLRDQHIVLEQQHTLDLALALAVKLGARQQPIDILDLDLEVEVEKEEEEEEEEGDRLEAYLDTLLDYYNTSTAYTYTSTSSSSSSSSSLLVLEASSISPSSSVLQHIQINTDTLIQRLDTHIHINSHTIPLSNNTKHIYYAQDNILFTTTHNGIIKLYDILNKKDIKLIDEFQGQDISIVCCTEVEPYIKLILVVAKVTTHARFTNLSSLL
jgi:hypothetical protein